MEMDDRAEDPWRKETVPRVMATVSSRLKQKDVYSLLLVSPWCYRFLLAQTTLWQARYSGIKGINLEFAQDIEDRDLILVSSKFSESLQLLENLNLNGCQKISDAGVQAIAYACPKLKAFSIYWNVRITDKSVKLLVNHCKEITSLNLSGCKNITDQSLFLIAENYEALDDLNLTRCVKLTDAGLRRVLKNCLQLRSLNLYALSSFTDHAYNQISSLKHLRVLDLCGAQNLTDGGLAHISSCEHLISLNLTWCVRITDAGITAISPGCRSLELLSLFGIVGVTDKCLESLSASCSRTLKTLDVNGCVGIMRRSREQLLRLFPNLECFKVHS
ncbi:RNI-like superfamily protein isoform X2 [Wolffia australiana]